jgi:hypothetical protein
MSRTACVWIPQFELRERLCALGTGDAAGDIDASGSIILADIGAPAPRVIDASAEARAIGVRPRMPMVRARALCPEALLIPPDAAAFRRERERVLGALYGFGPLVGVDEIEAFFLSLSGLGRLHPDELALAQALHVTIEELGYPAAVAIADSPVSAWIVARAASFALAAAGRAAPSSPAASASAQHDERCQVIPPGADRETLATLPLAALPMSEQVIRLCRVLGLDRVGELAQLPVGALTRRFGREGAVLEARSRARARDLFEVCVPEQIEQAELHLDQPTDDLEVLLFLHKNVLDRLLRQVAVSRRYVAALEVSLLMADSERSRLVHLVRPARPTLDSRLLLDLLLLWLQSGPATDLVDAIVMRATEIGEAPRRQLRLFEKQEDLAADAFALATSKLAAAFGRAAVVQPMLVDRHRPEARVAWRCPQSLADDAAGGKQGAKQQREKKRVRGWVARGLGRESARPADDLFTLLEGLQAESVAPAAESALGATTARVPPALELLEQPRPISLRGSWLRLPVDDVGGAPEVVEVGEGPMVVVEPVQGKVVPLSFARRRSERRPQRRAAQSAEPGWKRVVERLGPFSLEGEWWEPQGFARRYELLTLDDGSQLWIFHDGQGAFLQAYLD